MHQEINTWNSEIAKPKVTHLLPIFHWSPPVPRGTQHPCRCHVLILYSVRTAVVFGAFPSLRWRYSNRSVCRSVRKHSTAREGPNKFSWNVIRKILHLSSQFNVSYDRTKFKGLYFQSNTDFYGGLRRTFFGIYVRKKVWSINCK